MDHREREQIVEAAEHSAKKRRIKRIIIALAIVAVIAVVFIVLWGEGQFDPQGLFKYDYDRIFHGRQ